MWKELGICVALMLCLASVQAAVIRSEEQQEATTMSENVELEVSSTVEPEVSSTVEPEDSSTVEPTALNSVALSRDKEASVQIGLVSVDPAPGTMAADRSVSLMKSAKLLLLSTPAKRPAEVEQQLVEQDESETADAGSAEASVPATTELSNMQEQEESSTTENTETTTTTTESNDHKTTKLFAINATVSTQESLEPNVAVAVATDNATISIAEQPQAAVDNNVTIELALVEPEAEYVLLDASLALPSPTTHDELQLGSFTHIDSDVHLQPVVHSVEIVPTSFDDPLIVNYVHNLH